MSKLTIDIDKLHPAEMTAWVDSSHRAQVKKQAVTMDDLLAAQVPECFEFNKETIYPDCTVQVWENTETGDTSVGWWPNEREAE